MAVALEDLVSPSLVEYLRAGDERMVRPSPSATTARRREELGVRARLDAVVAELVDRTTPHGVDASLPPDARAKAAEALTLLVTDHQANRARLGGAPGVIPALVGLVERAWRDAAAHDPRVAAAQSVDKFVGAEAAAEAMWILAFDSADNHAALVSAGAVESLAGLLTVRTLHGVATPPRAAMWAAAALQNLAASFCATADGRCVWRWEADGRLRVDGEAALVVDSEATRTRIAAQPSVADALVQYACDGPVGEADAPREGNSDSDGGGGDGGGGDSGGGSGGGSGGVWPSQARVSSRDAPSVVPWAAAGALKNLALSPAVAANLLAPLPFDRAAHVASHLNAAAVDDGAPTSAPTAAPLPSRAETLHRCLCRLSTSPDWLERSKSTAALHYLRPRSEAWPSFGGSCAAAGEAARGGAVRAAAAGPAAKQEL